MTVSGQIRRATKAAWPRLATPAAQQPRHLAAATNPDSELPHNRLVALLSDPDRVVSNAAEAAFLRSIAPDQLPDAAAQYLAAAVDKYERHRRTVVADALVRFRASLRWYAVSANPFAHIMRDLGHPIHMVVRGQIRRGALGDDTGLLWRISVEPAWGSACRERLGQRLTRDELAAMRKASHLAANPRRVPCVVTHNDERPSFVAMRVRADEQRTASRRRAWLARNTTAPEDAGTPGGEMADLVRACDSDDPPLAAEALQALAATAIRGAKFHQVAAQFTERLDDEQHRVRAAVARVLTTVHDPRGLDTILAMLLDHRAAHRMAGLWAAERLLRAGLLSAEAKIVKVLASLGRSDRQSAIRARALRCLVLCPSLPPCATQPA